MLFRSGIRLVAGREFDERDAAGAPPVALVNQALARLLWPDREGTGRRMAVDPHDWNAWIQVVGVVEDTRHTDLASPPAPAYYVPRAQAWAPAMTLVARGAGPATATAAVRSSLAAAAPDLAAGEGVPLAGVVRDARGLAQVLTTLLTLLASIATALGALGLYASLAAWVARRRTEIGTRLALGASPAEIARAVLRSGVTLTAFGVLLGLAGGAMAGAAIRGLLFGVSPLDPLSFAIPAVLLLATGCVAALVPARRAAAVPPAQALRSEGR